MSVDAGPRIIYDRAAAAAALSCTPRYIDEMRRAGRLLAVRMGRTWKYRHDDLAAFADSLIDT